MARVAKALTNKTDRGKVPFMALTVIYIIPMALLLSTMWLWQGFIPALALHIFLKLCYKKDEYYLSYLFKEFRSPEVFGP